jgi:branched-chain amino acid transport system permease protein
MILKKIKIFLSAMPITLRNFIYPFLMIVMFLVGVACNNSFFQDVLIMIFFWGAAAQAWNLVGGYAGQFALGHSAFFGIGAYTSTLLFLRLSVYPWIGILVGGFLAAVIAAFIGFVTIRLKGPFFALATIAFGHVLYVLGINWKSITNGSAGLYIICEPRIEYFSFSDKISYLFVAIILFSIIFYVSKLIENSKTGYYLVAIRENEKAARTIGVNPLRYRVFAFALSAFFTAFIGTFYAQYIQFIEPGSVLGFQYSIQAPLIAIIGGVGFAYGPIVGSLITTPLGLFLRGWLGGTYGAIHMMIYGLVLVFVVLTMQEGIAIAIKNRFFSTRKN